MKQKNIPIPLGFCQCGCGSKTNVTRYHGTRRYIRNHHQSITLRTKHRVDSTTGCWILEGRKANKKTGYAGNISVNNHSELAHRGFYKLYKGEIPRGLTLDHLCRNRTCVNPAHLEPVTHAENFRRGSGCKLTMEKIRKIRKLFKTNRGSDLAIKYGVSHPTICDIIARRTWKEI